MKKSITIIISLFLILVTTPMLFCNEKENNEKTEKEKNIGDVICGPKCVSFLLKYYGKEEDIIHLVREIQYPELLEGTSLAKIAEALEKRGIYTFAMKIKPSTRLVWKYPVIVHLDQSHNEQIGHYVIWQPESRNNDLWIWDGDKDMQNYQERTWSKKRSGVVLLTSPEPITKPGNAVKWVGLPFYDVTCLIFAWIVFLSGAGLVVKTFWHSKRQKNFS
ncbi:MAG: hypothetical protein LBP59_16650 [Planctomycetaceae bacterium]|jgi:ABC-type bacteriocin/lantibiotic exporter with double-glycine peptidase domain|nr:hypothetical protein [Planctomycetaceae bacterium]